jgi:solute:Na+ symporter, SSS family
MLTFLIVGTSLWLLLTSLRVRPTARDAFLKSEGGLHARQIFLSTFMILGGGEFAVLVTFAYAYGVYSILYTLGIACGFLFLALLASRIRISENIHTMPEFLATTFDKKISFLVALLSGIPLISLTTIQLIVGTQLIAPLLGYDPIYVAFYMIVLAVVYTAISGMNAVLNFDATETMLISFVILGLLIFSYVSLFPEKGIVKPLEAYKPLLFPSFTLSSALSMFLPGFLGVLGGADVWQRIVTARSTKDARRGLLGSGLLWLLFGLVYVLLGLTIAVLVPSKTVAPNNELFHFITTTLPLPIAMMAALMIFIAVLSTADLEMFAAATIFGKLAAQGYRGEEKTETAIVWTRCALGAIGLITLPLFYIFKDNPSLLYWSGGFFAIVCAPVMALAVFRRGKPNHVLVALFLSATVAAGCVVYNYMHKLIELPAYQIILVITVQDKKSE